MTISTFLTQLVLQTISELVKNLAYFILVIWAVKLIVRQMPKWLEQWNEIKEREKRILWAKGGKVV